jgi:hypothetical protein
MASFECRREELTIIKAKAQETQKKSEDKEEKGIANANDTVTASDEEVVQSYLDMCRAEGLIGR